MDMLSDCVCGHVEKNRPKDTALRLVGAIATQMWYYTPFIFKHHQLHFSTLFDIAQPFTMYAVG